ncbi:hypothetical protein GCM10007897_03260 [Sphingobium jiangsuense]|uniref:peptidylprolyl isomerase n=1 Tax=Sphingobium jiangsuense TaxID=870476 RepID=A0A7W6BJ54_9SPHN|nr:peptidylprolyl isomerase [Sphingobium jiangsuense]MBB3926016.1 peptidyl-prolyl cis-trans isomerase C [Sphingobium jiangsuense]GLS98948.1 hypothetical protein GCM10007897_03260 [Sphingobium jiangsuense]
MQANALVRRFRPAGGGTIPASAGRLVRDPLFLFLIVGGAIFLAWHLTQRSRADPVTYTPAIEKQLVENFELVSGRKATPADREKLRDDYIGDELMFREALERGLHLSDAETRERLVDQLRYIVAGAPVEPTEEQMVDYYASHPDLYRTEPGISFSQVFFASRPADEAAILAALNRGEAVRGDDFWLGRDFPDYGHSMIRGMFGKPFLDRLEQGVAGVWQGPVQSSRGWHFVRKTGTKAPARIPYATARPQVRQDFMMSSTREALDREVAKLKEKYDVEITG